MDVIISIENDTLKVLPKNILEYDGEKKIFISTIFSAPLKSFTYEKKIENCEKQS